MKYLRQYKEQDLLFFDIETARESESLDKSPMRDAWLYKARNQNEISKKTGLAVTPEEYYKEKAALYSPFAKVITIVAGVIEKRGKDQPDALVTKVYSGDEKDILEEFNSDIQIHVATRPKAALAGFNNKKFDQPMLMNRMLINRTLPCELLDTAHLKPWDILAVDLAELWQSTKFYPDSMFAVASAFGLSCKTDLSGADVSDAYYAGKIKEIERYCVQDVLTTANIFRSFAFKDLVVLA